MTRISHYCKEIISHSYINGEQAGNRLFEHDVFRFALEYGNEPTAPQPEEYV